MADTPAPSEGTPASPGSSTPPGEAPAAANAVRSELEAALPTIREALASARTLIAEIEGIKTRAIISQGALDEHVISAKKGAADLTVQLEAARKHSTEISALTGAATGGVSQAKELVGSAAAALESLGVPPV